MDPIDEIKQKLDIVAFIQPYVALKQAGRNFKGLCPFHGEKTPSFMVSPERQTWHCFGCNKGGDVIAFYQEIEHLEFYEALKSLAERTGVQLKYQEPEQAKKKNELYQINELTAKFYHYLLTNHKIGEAALAYVINERKLLNKTIATFQIGYAPSGWDKLLKFLKKHGISEGQAYAAGVISKNARGYFDMFRERIMFPLHDHRGNVVGFAGRILTNQKDSAKYINTPETQVYIKGNTLYGLYQNAEEIREAKKIILVEGELDMLSCYQAGVKNVVAMKGTALTVNQLSLIRRYANKVILALDEDAAGQSATRRSIELALREGLDIRIAMLPQNIFGNAKDVDDISKKSPQLWEKTVSRAQPYYEWLLATILNSYDLRDPFAKSKAAQEALPFILGIDNEIVREYYLKKLANRLDTTPFTLMRQLKKSQAQVQKKMTSSDVKDETKPLDTKRLNDLLSLLFQSKTPQQYLDDIMPLINDDALTQSAEKTLWQKLVAFYVKDQEAFSLETFLKAIPKELSPTVDLLFLSGVNTQLFHDPLKIKMELHKTAQRLRQLELKAKRAKIMAQMAKIPSTDPLARTKVSQEYERINTELKNLSI